jgi:hypothetical protein
MFNSVLTPSTFLRISVRVFAVITLMCAVDIFSTARAVDLGKNSRNPGPGELEDLLNELKKVRCGNDFRACMKDAGSALNNPRERLELQRICRESYISCLVESVPKFNPEEAPDFEVVPATDPVKPIIITPSPNPNPSATCPQMSPGDQRTWRQWANDSCSDAIDAIGENIDGLVKECVSALENCVEGYRHPIGSCGDGCDGRICVGGSGIYLCPPTNSGVPVAPGFRAISPVRLPIPALPGIP